MSQDPVWWDDRHLNQSQHTAVVETLFDYVVGVFPHNGAAPATGTLVTWKDRPFVLTASHVLEGVRLNEVRFYTRDVGPIVRIGPEEALRKYGPPRRAGERFDIRGVAAESNQHRDDLVILELSSLAGVSRYARFYHLVDKPLALTDGTTVLTMGYAEDSSVAIAPGRRGIAATDDFATFSSTLNARTDLHSSYDSARQFLLPFTRLEDGIEPHGMSGAGAWSNSNPLGQLWAAHPVLVGVVSRWHRAPNLLQITNLDSVLELFRQIE